LAAKERRDHTNLDNDENDGEEGFSKAEISPQSSKIILIII